MKRLAACERQATAALVALLAAVDERRLYLDEGYSSLFVFCTVALHLSESGAYRRIEAARAATRIPAILPRPASGELTLTAVVLLAPYLTDANAEELLDAARHEGKRSIARLLAERFPKPDVPTARRVPARFGPLGRVRRVLRPFQFPLRLLLIP